MLVPIMYSSVRRGVMSSTNNLPDDEPTGTAANRLPLASKCASMNVPVRLRSHDAARGSELAAGLYRAKLAKMVSPFSKVRTALRRGWIIFFHGMLYISYSVPGDETYPDNVPAASLRPCPNKVSLLITAPRLNDQLFQRIVSLSSRFCDRYFDLIGAATPVDCAW